MFSEIDSNLHNIPHIHIECGDILWSIVNPTKHCYVSD